MWADWWWDGRLMTGIHGCSECRHALPAAGLSWQKRMKKQNIFSLPPGLSLWRRGKKDTNRTSPVNGDSLPQEVFVPNPFHFQVSTILVLSHCSDGQSTFQRCRVPLHSERRGERYGQWGAQAIPHLLQTNQSSKTNYCTLHWDMLIPN